MKLADWLKGERGRLTATARHFGVTSSAISQWATDGVPLQRMKALRSHTDGAVTLEDMVPDSSQPAANAFGLLHAA